MKEHRESAGKTEGKARKLLRLRLRERAVHESGLRPFQGPHQERITVEELLENLERDWEIRGRKGIPQLRSHLKHVRAFFAMDRALAVTPERLRDYIASRQKEEAAPATANRELEGLQRAFALALDSGTLAMAPKFPSLPERNARQGFFERGDFQAVLENIGDSDVGDFLTWFYWTGMRPGEIRSLTWACFDRETWTVRLHAKDAKTGFGRAIALEGPLQEIIRRRLSVRQFGCDLIFHQRGKSIGEFRKRWNRACALAGVSGRVPYDLRRTAIRNLIRAGVPERVAMSISGHRTRAVFDRYNIVSEKDLREAMCRTAAYVESLPGKQSVVPIQKVSGTVR
jgi:integrase